MTAACALSDIVRRKLWDGKCVSFVVVLHGLLVFASGKRQPLLALHFHPVLKGTANYFGAQCVVILVFLTDCEITTIQCALDDYCMYVEAARRYDLPLFSLEIDRCLHSRQGNCSSAGFQEVGKSSYPAWGHHAIWQARGCLASISRD